MAQPTTISSVGPRLRRCLLWVHLTCGLVLSLYAIVLGITGSILIFRDELTALTYPEFHNVSSRGSSSLGDVSPDTVLHETKTAFPEWRAVSVTWPNQDTPDWMVYLIRGSDAREAYLNPETGKLVGLRDLNADWIGWLLRMHVNFHAGATGRLANGYGACALLGLCLTGIILWWPPVLSSVTRTRQFATRFRVDLRSGWRRLAWQLHHATGIISLAFIVILAFTGGYYVWLQDYIKVVDRFFERSIDPKVPARNPSTPMLTLTNLASITRQQFPGRPLYRASIPSPDQPVRITVLEARPQQFHLVSSVALDPVTGAVLQIARLDQRPVGNSILTWFSVLHFGRFGGDGPGFWLVKIVWALLALSLPILAISGCLMWWKRVMEPRLRKVSPAIIGDPKIANPSEVSI